MREYREAWGFASGEGDRSRRREYEDSNGQNRSQSANSLSESMGESIRTRQKLLRRQPRINVPVISFIQPLVLPIHQPTREQKRMIAAALSEKQRKIEELEKELRLGKRLLLDDGDKIERVIYQNPLECIATILMISERGRASLRNIEEICAGKTVEVLCNCIKNDLVQSSGSGFSLTPLGVQCASGWRRWSNS